MFDSRRGTLFAGERALAGVQVFLQLVLHLQVGLRRYQRKAAWRRSLLLHVTRVQSLHLTLKTSHDLNLFTSHLANPFRVEREETGHDWL